MPIPANPPHRQIRNLQPERKCVGAIGLRIIEEELFALAAERETGVQTRRVGLRVAKDHQETAGWDGDTSGEDELERVAVVA